MSEASNLLDDLDGKLGTFARLVNVVAKDEEIRELEGRMSEPSFWTDQGRAKQVVATLKAMKGVVEPYKEMSQSLSDCRELLTMAENDNDSRTQEEVAAELRRLLTRYDDLELKLALSGQHDRSNVYMNIKPGAGGTEACDWAQMLFRMYSGYCGKNGFGCEIVDMLPGEEAGLKDCTLYITGPNAYGYLKAEMGTHRLVRMSPFNADGKRQTSFAAIQVTPELDETADINVADISEKDLRIDTYRAGGAGGQHINKTDSAVRVTHLPSGIVVACQKERSQIQNRLTAMKMLAAKLQQLQEAERLEELKDLQGERGTIGWGHQIRSYVLAPYQMVKDLRTGHETNRTEVVLAGDVQPFIDAYLRWRLGGSKDRKAKDAD